MHGFRLSEVPLDVPTLRGSLLDARAGGYASFEGWVRDHHAGRAVDGLDYQAYTALAEIEGGRICVEHGWRHGRFEDAGRRWEAGELGPVIRGLVADGPEPEPVYGA